jgi:cytoskeletal protein RodZ
MENQRTTVTPGTQSSEPAPSVTPPIKVKHAHKFILGYIALILLVAALGGVYSWQHKKVNDSNAKIASLQSQLSSLKSQVSKPSKEQAQSTKTTTTTPATTPSASSLQITQLGIEIPLTSSIADLSYTWDNSNSSAKLGSASLMKENEQENPSNCSPTNTSVANPTYPIATVINSKNAGSGSFGASGSPGGPTKTVNISGQIYYWYLPGAGDGCTDPTSTFTNQLNAYYNSALDEFNSATAIK